MFVQLKNSVQDLSEGIGEVLRPTVEVAIEKLRVFTDWVKENPALVKKLTIGILAAASAMLLLGAGFAAIKITQFVLDIPTAIGQLVKLASMIWAKVLPALIAVNAFMGPKGWIILGLAAAAAIGTYFALKATMGGGSEAAEYGKMIEEQTGAAEAPEGLQEGGIIRHRPGGTIVRVGEGGEDEAVFPISKVGTTINNYFNIQNMSVRSDDDIRRLAQELGDYQRRRSLATGAV